MEGMGERFSEGLLDRASAQQRGQALTPVCISLLCWWRELSLPSASLCPNPGGR